MLRSGLVLATQILHQTAGLLTAFAFVLVSINAMRVGLLTRFMGALGVIVGAVFVIPIGSSFIIQGFWMVAVGFMLIGRFPGGRPPAWDTGHAEPWPTQQELREARSGVAGKPEPAARRRRRPRDLRWQPPARRTRPPRRRSASAASSKGQDRAPRVRSLA